MSEPAPVQPVLAAMTTQEAEAIRDACLEAARGAYQDAGVAGLCEEGRIELALDAIRSLDMDAVLARDRREPTGLAPPAPAAPTRPRP